MKTKWPKKQSITDYIRHNYTDGGRSRTAILSDLKQGKLPGIKDGGKWYIYVLVDGSPAYGYSETRSDYAELASLGRTGSIKLTGNRTADAILARATAGTSLGLTPAQ